MSQSFALLQPPAAPPVELAPTEIRDVEHAFRQRAGLSFWVGYAALDQGRVALFFRDAGDPVLTLSREPSGAVSLRDRRGVVVASAHDLPVLLRWLTSLGPNRH